MPGKTALILGGGVGELVAADRLRRALPRDHRVILIERERQHLFQPSLLWVAVGDRRPEQIQRPLDRLARKGVELVTATVEAIDPSRRVVTAGGREHMGDAMIIALGAELAPEAHWRSKMSGDSKCYQRPDESTMRERSREGSR